jgi:hypothetical protein
VKRCYCCGTELDVGRIVGRGEICPQCHRDVRCCCNCAFHDPHTSNQCREPQSETVSDRAAGNFCDYFRFVDAAEEGQGNDAAQKAREELERLFRK